MRISDWSSDVCASDLFQRANGVQSCRWPKTESNASGRAPGGRFHPDDIRQPILNGFPLRRVSRLQHARTNEAKRHLRSEEHTSELQSLMRISYAVFCLKKKKETNKKQNPLDTFKILKTIINELNQVIKDQQ